MTVHELLLQLRALNVRVSLEAGRLRVIEPAAGILSEALWRELQLNKEDLLRVLEHATQSSKTRALITRAERPQNIPLSFAQQRLWFLAQLEGVSEAYNIPLALRLIGKLDRHALKRSLDRIVWRHEALRTTFHRAGEEPVQLIADPGCGFDLQEADLSSHKEPATEMDKLMNAEASRGFDLEQGPIIRGQLVRLAPQEHILLITMHHIVSDGWSLGVFIRELTKLYRAYHAGEEDPLSPLAIQYADYAIWQQQRLAGELLQRESEYWRRTLEGAPAFLELPTNRPRPDRQAYAGDLVQLELDASLTRGLKSLARRHEITLFMLAAAAWAVVLSRLAGQEEVVIGTVTANRRHPELEPLIGFFVNTLALRVQISGTIAELLQRVKARMLDVQEHQELPFERIVEVVKPPRSLAHTPVFQVMLTWQSGDERITDFGGLNLAVEPVYHVVAKFDLGLDLHEAGDRIVGGLKYATALFDRGTVERHVGYLQQVLTAMVADSQQEVIGIDLLSPQERILLLQKWNATEVPYPEHLCIHQLFEEQVRKTPHATAIIHENQSFTYAELNRQANRLAHHLISLNVIPDDRVAICAQRSPGLVVGLMAILKAGAAYVPLDPLYPSQRLLQILTDAAPRIVLSDSSGRTALGENALEGLTLLDLNESQPSQWANLAITDPDPEALNLTSRHLAYVIYTSGSTGTPKGVMIEHRSVVNFLWSMRVQPGMNSNDRLLALTTVSFDIAALELYLPLITGAQIILAGQETALDGWKISQLIEQRDVTVLQATPVTWRLLIEDKSWRGPHLRAFCGGEALPSSLSSELLSRVCALWNLYGPTETTIWSCIHQIIGSSEGATESIGSPIANTHIYILDDRLEPVPIGVVGEIYIGGNGVARGYLGRPDLTHQRFIPNPFSSAPERRIYRTGDLGRWREGGSIEYVGRNDFQVKVRGFRIELGEIEARLAEHPSVRDVVVLAREDHAGDKRLVAYVTATESTEEDAAAVLIDAEALRAHLRLRLPEYMVPAAYVRLEKLPLTPNGKVDRKRLPAPDADAYVARGYEAPIGEAESIVAQIWAEVLKLERVGRNDNFFELGGHSLLALTVIRRMREAGLLVDVPGLFATPTPKSLAESAGHESRVATPNLTPADGSAASQAVLSLASLNQSEIDKIMASVPGGATNVQDIYRLTPLQEGILFHHLLEKKGDVYLATTMLAVPTRERLDSYVEALQVVIDRHDILRTAVVWEGLPEPIQVVWRHASLKAEEVKLDARAGDIAEQLRARFSPRHYRLDVRDAPLWRLFIAEDSPNSRWVMLEMRHHLVSDNTSARFLLREVDAIMRGEAEYLPVPLPFRNFVAQARSGVSREEHEAFFTRMLADVDESTAPFGLTDVQGHGGQILETRLEVDSELCRRLGAQARGSGVSVASLCHFAWALVLARSSGREDVVFGTVMSGRMHGAEDVDRVLGMFINTLPIRIRVGGESVRESVRQTHELLTQLLRHEHAPLALAQRCSGVRAPAPLFTSLLNYRHTRAEASSAEKNLKTSQNIEFLGGEERTNYPVDLSINDSGQALSLHIQVDEAIDPRQVCAMMHTALDSLATALERDPTISARHLDVLPLAERHRLLVEWNATAAEYPVHLCIHHLFEAQVARTPHAIAVADEVQAFTYADLNRRADHLARYLTGLGVVPDDRIALCAERGLEMVVGILGILKAGGAYVPFDPKQPAERLEYMLRDAAPRVLLRQSKFRDHISEYQGHRIELDGNWQIISQESSCTFNIHAENLAYVIYTSGSTGMPKAVAVEHRQVCNQLFWAGTALDLGPEDRVLQKTSFTFDASIVEILLPLVRGAQIIVARPAGEQDADYLAHLIIEKAITYVDVVPALLEQLLEHPLSKHWTSLRVMCCGGDVLKPELVQAFYRRSSAMLWNAYGPTETTVQSAVAVCREDRHSIPIGKPIANTQIYVLDSSLDPVPLGVIGELYIGGAGVTRGYLNQPALTAEKFIPDLFSSAAGARLYRTGDLAKWRPDGNLVYVGRADFQVKIRGFRIEPGEIEARLIEHPSVGDAAVLAREDQPGNKRLVAYVTPRRPAGDDAEAVDIDVDGLRVHLSSLLPDYMVPAMYVPLAQLPLTANGKLDRKRLPAPDGDMYGAHEYQAPLGEVEATVARIWADVLKLDRISRNDNFFELGGHSLLVVKVANLLRQCGIETTVAGLFDHPTVESFAASLPSIPIRSARRGAQKIREGTQTPLFLVHDGYGDEVYFSVLAQYLPRELPVYGLPGVLPNELTPHTMRAMAERMIRLIQKVHATGRYRLAGWSFGGVLAYEIAQLLLDQGHTVEFLGLIDSWNLDGLGIGHYEERTPEVVLRHLCEGQNGLNTPDPGLGFDELFNHYRVLGALPENFEYLSSHEAHVRCRNLDVHSRAMAAYRPKAISIPVHLFAASERPSDGPALTRTLGWERCVPEYLLYVQTVPGTHHSLMKAPHIKTLGRRLTESLATAVSLPDSFNTLQARAGD